MSPYHVSLLIVIGVTLGNFRGVDPPAPLRAQGPKIGGLQMDWLRAEDLKGEKVVTTPAVL
jgi:hypothetical protein